MTRKLQIVSAEAAKTRRRPPPAQRTHDEIYGLVEEIDQRARSAVEQSASIALTVEGLGKKLDEKFHHIESLIGSVSTDERGDLIGTGIAGHLARLEHKVETRFKNFDGWLMFGRGLALASVILGPIIYWLITTHVSIKFGE